MTLWKLIRQPSFKKLVEKGILIMDVGPREFRMVTHLEISDEGVEQCLQAFKGRFRLV